MSLLNPENRISPKELDEINKIFEELYENASKTPMIPRENQILTDVSYLANQANAIELRIGKDKGDPYSLFLDGYLTEKVMNVCKAYNNLVRDYNLIVPKEYREEQLVCDQYQKGNIDASSNPEEIKKRREYLYGCLVRDTDNKLVIDEDCKTYRDKL